MIKERSVYKDRDEIIKLQELISKDPQDFVAYIKLAELYYYLGNKIEAFSLYRTATKRFPDMAMPYIQLGNIYFGEQKFQEAYQCYQKASEIDPNEIEAKIGLAKIFQLYGEMEEVIEICSAALQLDPDEPDILKMLLPSIIKTGNYKKAQDLGKKLHDMNLDQESHNFVNFYLGLISIKRKEFNKALFYLGNVTQNSKYYGKSLNNIALVYSNVGNSVKSEEIFEKLLHSTDAIDEISNDFQNDSRNDFQNDFQEIRLNPDVWINFGLILEQNKKFERAFSAYTKANELRFYSWPWADKMKKLFIDPKDTDKAAEKQENLDTTKIKGKIKNLKYSLYLGCVIPNRYPMIEAATRIFLDELHIRIDEMEGAGCCPAPGVFRSFNIPTWLTLGARNITIAEQNQSDILTMCNGCYGTLNEVNHILQSKNSKKEMVNQHLEKIGRKYEGTSKVKHILEVMYYDIGLKRLKENIVQKWDMDVAVHYGCHILKPADTKPWHGEFEDPRFFDELVELTGCHSVNYKNKMQCCGAGGGVRSAVKEVSLDFTFEKLRCMRETGVQAIITCCPFCQLQLDLGQLEVNSVFKSQIEEPFRIPVIYITQLFDYSFGKDPYKIGLLRPNSLKGTPPFIDTMPIFERYYENI